MKYFIGQKFGKEGQIEIVEFLGNIKRKGECRVICHVCKLDRELFGNAIYTTTKNRLGVGKIPCGCSGKPNWTDYQYRVKIKRKCLEYDLELINIKDEKTLNSNTTLILKCSCGYSFERKVFRLLNDNKKCRACCTRGFKINLPAYLYVLKIQSESTSFVGFGITKNLHERLTVHKRKLADKGYKILDVTTFEFKVGIQALTIENLIKRGFNILNKEILGFVSESVETEDYENLIDFIEIKMEEIEDYGFIRN